MNNYRCKIKLQALVYLLLISVNWIPYCFAETEHAVDNISIGNVNVEFLKTFKNSHYVSSVAWHPDGNYLATGGLSKIISIWDIKKAKKVKTLDQQVGAVGALAYSPDGKYLAAGRTFTTHIPEKYHVNIYDAENSRLIRSFIPPQAEKRQNNNIDKMSFSADSKLLAVNRYRSWSRGVVYNIENGSVVATLENVNSARKIDPINSLSFSTDDNYLAVGRTSGAIDVWSKKDWELSYSFTGHKNGVYSLAFSPDGDFIAAASKKKNEINKINIWKLPARKLSKSLKNEHFGWVRRLQYSPDGNILLSGGADKTVALFNMEEPYDKKILGKFPKVAYPYISPDGSHLAIAYGKNVELWGLTNK